MKRVSILSFLALAVGLAGHLRADTVAEWKFDGAAELSGGEMVKLDIVEPKASADSKLMERSSVQPLETGLGEKWSESLQRGYLDAPVSVGTNSPNNAGLRTVDASPEDKNGGYRNYMGFSGLGAAAKNHGGTVYLVLKPNMGWQATVKRRALFGTGHTGEGLVRLGLNEQKVLALTVGKVAGDVNAVTTTLEVPWEADKWYFIAASWQEGSPPVVYVREMSGEGPAASPEAKSARGETMAPGGMDSPKTDPLVIGANWYNPGGGAAVIDGADAQIAYARVDNAYSSEAEIAAVFNSLGTP